MKQGVLTPGRVRILMHRGVPCFRGHGRRNGERRRKSVRGCIVSHDLSTLNLVIVKQGECSEQAVPALCFDMQSDGMCMYSLRMTVGTSGSTL